MANLTIDNTTKANWITIIYNAASTTDIIKQFPIDRVDGLDIEAINGEAIVEIYVAYFSKPLYLTDNPFAQNLIVDTVNGVAPTSLVDLKDKLLALL